MAEYKVHIHIDKDTLKALSNDGYSLCIQKYLNNGVAEIANIVVHSKAPATYSSQTTFTWVDKYEIAASDTPYEEGGYLTETATNPLPISITTKDSFVLTSWSDYTVKHSQPIAPENGFAFEPGKAIANPGASATVYLANFTEGSGETTKVPFFMSPKPSIGGSQTMLVPLEKVIVFFNRGPVKTGSMISQSRAYEILIDLTAKHEQAWNLDNSKAWAPVD